MEIHWSLLLIFSMKNDHRGGQQLTKISLYQLSSFSHPREGHPTESIVYKVGTLMIERSSNQYTGQRRIGEILIRLIDGPCKLLDRLFFKEASK
jgi:hypothetical protein